jgi:hypothetical protein
VVVVRKEDAESCSPSQKLLSATGLFLDTAQRSLSVSLTSPLLSLSFEIALSSSLSLFSARRRGEGHDDPDKERGN